VSLEENGNILRFQRYWMTCLCCHFAEQQRWDVERKDPVFSPEMYGALRARAPYADQHAMSLLQSITIQFQIACGRKGPWNRETFVDLPTSSPNRQGPYLNLLETTQAFDTQIGPTGLDLYYGQAAGQTKNNSAWMWLPLRMKEYEKQSKRDTTTLQLGGSEVAEYLNSGLIVHCRG